MPLLNDEQLRLLRRLRKGSVPQYHLDSPPSRADIDALIAAGIPLSVDSRRLKILHADNLLDEMKIRHAMVKKKGNLLQPQTLRVVDSVKSTNDEIKNMELMPAILLAEQQVQGRGRYGRNWMSLFADGLYMSVKWARESHHIAGLSLAVGVMVATALSSLNIATGLKWPNDVMADGEKVAGILVELATDYMIIGIGINYAESPRGTSLRRLWNQGGHEILSRNRVAVRLIDELLTSIPLFVQHGFAFFHSSWGKRDILKGTFIEVRNGQRIGGLCTGVSTKGNLLVDVDGKIHALKSGTLAA